MASGRPECAIARISPRDLMRKKKNIAMLSGGTFGKTLILVFHT